MEQNIIRETIIRNRQTLMLSTSKTIVDMLEKINMNSTIENIMFWYDCHDRRYLIADGMIVGINSDLERIGM
jgi:hypothetical protein